MSRLLFDVLQAVESADMPPAHRHLMIRLANYAGEDARAWPSFETLARATGMARSTVIEAIGELVAAGWLERLPSRGLSTTYSVKTSGGAIGAHARKRPDGKAEVDRGAVMFADGRPRRGLGVTAARSRGDRGADGGVTAARTRSSHSEPPSDPPKEPPTHARDGGEPAGVAGHGTADPAPAQGDPVRQLKLIDAGAQTSTTRNQKRGSGTDAHKAHKLYAEAYAAGIRDAAGGEFTPPTDSHDRMVFRNVLRAHAKGADGSLLMGASLLAWIRASAAEYRRARADRAAFESGFKPARWQAWLDSGKALATPPARASPRARVQGGEIDRDRVEQNSRERAAAAAAELAAGAAF